MQNALIWCSASFRSQSQHQQYAKGLSEVLVTAPPLKARTTGQPCRPHKKRTLKQESHIRRVRTTSEKKAHSVGQQAPTQNKQRRTALLPELPANLRRTTEIPNTQRMNENQLQGQAMASTASRSAPLDLTVNMKHLPKGLSKVLVLAQDDTECCDVVLRIL